MPDPGRAGLRAHVGRAVKLDRPTLATGLPAWRTHPFPCSITVRSRAGASLLGQKKPGIYTAPRVLCLEPVDCELPDRGRYPHQCLRCGAPAFIGIQVDCLNKCR